jgi:stage IV sporulation protein FB
MKLSDTRLKISWTWWLTVTIITIFSLYGSFSIAGLLSAWIFALIIFVVIFGHEFAHAIVAKYFGCKVPLIEINGLGGAAHIQNIKKLSKLQSSAVSMAGPIFNLLSFALLGFLIYIPGLSDLSINLIAQIAILNLYVGLFNMAPFYPLDGGKVYQHILSTFMSDDSAKELTHVAGTIGALLFVVVSIITNNPILLLVAVVIYTTNKNELDELS